MPKVPEMVASGRLQNTRQKTLERHAEWWELRRQGYGIEYIAREFGVSHQAVSKAMSAMEAKLYEVLAADAKSMKARQTAILEANLEKALLEWERSKEAALTEKVVEKAIAPSGEDAPVRDLKAEIEATDLESIPGYFYDADGEEVPSELRPRLVADYLLERLKAGAIVDQLVERQITNTTEHQCGDVRYLAEIRATLAEIRKIWGLDAPVKQELTGKDGNPVAILFTESLNRVYGGDES